MWRILLLANVLKWRLIIFKIFLKIKECIFFELFWLYLLYVKTMLLLNPTNSNSLIKIVWAYSGKVLVSNRCSLAPVFLFLIKQRKSLCKWYIFNTKFDLSKNNHFQTSSFADDISFLSIHDNRYDHDLDTYRTIDSNRKCC